jgi:hypothetical protein
MGGGSAPQRNLYNETAGELQARLDLAPDIYAAQAEYGGPYQALQLQQLEALMNGTPGGPQTYTTNGPASQAGWYDAQGNLLGVNPNQYGTTARFGGSGQGGVKGQEIPEGVRWLGAGAPIQQTHTINTQASPGLLALLQEWAPKFSEIDATNLRSQREADIRDVSELGASSRTAIDAADPETANLIRMMTESATNDLALGSRLSPEDERQVNNSTMARAGASGWGYNPGDLARTAVATTEYGRQLEDRRRKYAAGITGLRSGYYGDAFNRVLGRPAGTSPQSWYGSAMGTADSAGVPNFASSINANDVYNTNYNARVSQANTNANNQAALTGAGISAGIGILGALI